MLAQDFRSSCPLKSARMYATNGCATHAAAVLIRGTIIFQPWAPLSLQRSDRDPWLPIVERYNPTIFGDNLVTMPKNNKVKINWSKKTQLMSWRNSSETLYSRVLWRTLQLSLNRCSRVEREGICGVVEEYQPVITFQLCLVRRIDKFS